MSTRSDKCEDLIDEARRAIPDLEAAEYEDGPLEAEEAAEVTAALRRAVELLDGLSDAAEECTKAIKEIENVMHEVER